MPGSNAVSAWVGIVSNWGDTIEMKDELANDAADSLLKIIFTNPDLPQDIVSDRGFKFKTELWRWAMNEK